MLRSRFSACFQRPSCTASIGRTRGATGRERRCGWAAAWTCSSRATSARPRRGTGRGAGRAPGDRTRCPFHSLHVTTSRGMGRLVDGVSVTNSAQVEPISGRVETPGRFKLKLSEIRVERPWLQHVKPTYDNCFQILLSCLICGSTRRTDHRPRSLHWPRR